MNNDFYYWEIDEETGFRKLIIKEFQTVFETELSKFNNWDGKYKYCKYCSRYLPKSDYFFQNWKQGSDGLFFKCKECEGHKFAWGLNKKKEFKNNGVQYCESCDTVYPMNDIYFVKNKKSSTGYARNCKQCGYYKSSFGINRYLNEIIKDKKDDFQICLGCYLELPQNEVYYFRQRNGIDKPNNFESKCKKCNGSEYKITMLNYIYKNRLPKSHRICLDCNQVLHESEFHFKNKKKNRRYSVCKRCNYISQLNRRHDKLHSNYSYDDWLFALNYWADVNGNIHCAYCNELVKNPEMEHIIPYSLGGKFVRENIIPICKDCNLSKNNKTLDEFYLYSDKFTYDLYSKVIEYINLVKSTKEKIS